MAKRDREFPNRTRVMSVSDEQLEEWMDDCNELSSLRMRESGDEYHDDDLAFIEQAYSSFFDAIAEVRRLRELLETVTRDEPDGWKAHVIAREDVD